MIPQPSHGISWVAVGTLGLLIVLFSVVTYVSWGTSIGNKKRYYYYAHAVLALGFVLAVIGYLISDAQRRSTEQQALEMSIQRINQRYWINLERFFAQHAPALNRL